MPGYVLPEIPYLRLRVTLRAVDSARLPGYKGSMLRGAFGHALRRAVCAMGPRQPCATCTLRGQCVYPRLFETLIEHGADGREPPPFLKGLPTAPRPYVFEPSLDEMGRRDYAPGDPLRFDLLLFGRAVELQAYALVALERMARGGLGRGRRRCHLESVEYPDGTGGWRTGFHAEGTTEGGDADGAGARLWEEHVPPAHPDPAPLHRTLESGSAGLDLLTPLRLKRDGRLAEGFSFRELAFRMIRRTLEVAHFHVPDAALDWHFRPLLEAASAVAVTERDLRWHDWERWSNRQRTSMRLGGHVGRLRLEGELTPFAPLLATAQLLHVGKGTTFGLGWVAVR